MKKFSYPIAVFLFFVSLLVMASCDKNEGFLGSHNEASVEGLVEDYKVVIIDGCEYVIYDASRGYSGYGFMAHKGNCKNPIHNH